MGTKELRGPSLVETLAGSAHQALDDSLEHAFCLAELNTATAVFAFIDRGQRALANRQPKLAFLYFLNAYVLYPEQDSRLLHWLARAASEQGAGSPEGQLHRLADQIQTRDVTDDRLPSGATVALRGCGNQPPTPVVKNPNSAEPPPHPVDIIIPVYRGERETLECLRSLIQALPENRTPHQLLVLNDASPEPMLVSALEQLAASVGQLRLIHHPTNLGFIRGVNRAIAVNPERDLVLLNSDARVCGDWLDRLRAWAYCKPDVASVTPFSNHGELMTFPDPRRRYQKPEPADHARLDAFARSVETSEAPVELVVGCGFCMYLRRAAIDAVGPLDETNLLAGYGEDTEWCLRASDRGWKHVAARNVFVAHRGSASFGDDKARRVARNNAVIRKLYPGVDRAYEQYVARDPLLPARQAIQRLRFAEVVDWARQASGPEPALGSCHPHPRHLHLLAPSAIADPTSPFFVESPRSLLEPRVAPAGLLGLVARYSHRGLHVQLLAALPSLPFELTYQMPQDLVRLRQDLMHLPLLGLVDHRPQRPLSLFRSLAQQLNLPIVPFSSCRRHGRSAAGVSAGQVGALSSGSLLIADPLHDPILRQTWILRARDLAHRSNTSVRLLVLDDNASLPELLATGRVLRLPELPGIPLHELVQLVGCKAAVTQSGETSAGHVALSLAKRLNLPLLSATAFVPALWRSEFRETTQVLQAQHQHLKYQETAASMTDAPPKATALSPTAEQSTQDVARSDEPDASVRKTFLNIGCGNTAIDRLPALFQTKQWQQLRLDIDPAVSPDITASSSDLSAVEDESVAAVYTSHTLEHLESHEVPVALREMYRVLTADGFALITLPDLQAVAQLIVDGRLTETAYESPVGPITALDMVYGHRDSLMRGNRYMAHRTGFDTHHLGESLLAAGFAEVRVRKGHCYDLWAFAFKQVPNSDPPWLALPMSQSKNAT